VLRLVCKQVIGGFPSIGYGVGLIIQEELEDFESLKSLRDAKDKEADAPSISLSKAKQKLDLE